MAAAMIRGMTQAGMRDIVVSEPDGEKRKGLERTFGVRTTADNTEVARNADPIILAVKPQDMDAVLDEAGDAIAEEKIVSLTVDERDTPGELEVGRVPWIIDGKSEDP